MPALAVVIPVFNAQAWIADTVRSVLHQDVDRDRIELILIDDVCTDESIRVAEDVLRTSPVRYRILKGTGGWASRSRNLGWRATDAEWIQFLDADDLLHPRKLSLHAAAAEWARENVAVLYSKWQRLSCEEGRWTPTGEIEVPELERDPDYKVLETKGFLQLGAALFRRTWLEQVNGFDENLRPVEDVNLLLRIACHGGGFHYVDAPEPVVLYRQRPGSFSKQSALEFIECCMSNAAWAEDHWRRTNRLDAPRSGVLVDAYFFGARAFAGRDWKRFADIHQRILSLSPRFIPPGPRLLRYLSRAIGYPAAERVAVMYRSLRGAGVPEPFRREGPSTPSLGSSRPGDPC